MPPPPEQRTMFDVLPVVLQTHPDERPKVFTLPPQYVARVPIVHPQIPGFEELGKLGRALLATVDTCAPHAWLPWQSCLCGHALRCGTSACGCHSCMIHAYMDRVSKSTERTQADASTLPSP